ncbi:hypothetical protein LV457_11700 [Mycobacterium sp. MYCO198283]|uniref:hypothetical protein n=1 Tax=Mycobacterium sp. MYCO198283 TaxID=2883505 RepID=UPI001E3BABDC|nr:hypothetical protein [Mycobacterium sp. MYCO198283]MCG5432945.1 hypothetical protein [Mycobacterium sp. MYCO198283]
MGDVTAYVPVQLTRAFRQAQSDPTFQCWLKMQEAAMDIEFPYYDLPGLQGRMFEADTLQVVESALLDMYANHREAFNESNIHTTMRYAYYIGETMRRAFEGRWVVLPANDERSTPMPAIDYPFREGFTTPTDSVKIVVNRRTGHELMTTYGIAQRGYNAWVDAGRPERTFLGKLREEDQ